MEQMELFDAPRTLDPGTTWWAGNWQLRNWHGFQQEREGGSGPWQFRIYAFGGPEDGDGTAAVYKINSRGALITTDVPIDTKGRILVLGKRYGRDHWCH